MIWNQCLQGTGNFSPAVWLDRLVLKAVVTAELGHVYTTSEPGRMHVIEAADKFRLVTTNWLAERCLATPAITNADLVGIPRII